MFEFSEEHKMVGQMVRRWATEKLEPQVEALEANEMPPYDLMRDFAKTFGLPAMVRGAFEKMEKKAKEGGGDGKSAKLGGLAGGDAALSAILSVELCRVCPGFMLAFGASLGLAGSAIVAKGTLEQKKRWGLPILTLDKVGCWGMTEAGAGSDAFRAMHTVAVPKGDGYVINGSKTFITNAPYADISVIYAKIDHGDDTPLADRPIQAFIVESDDKGIELSKPMKKMGMHTSPTGEIFLDDCYVDGDRLLGLKEKKVVGRESGKDVFHSERTGAAPMCVGIIQRCLEISTAYALERVTWGKKIAEYQLIQDKLANMFVHLQNCECLMYKQLEMTHKGKNMNAAEASATKVYCARAATECALDAVQILGGNGYMQEYKVEMFMRDAKLLQIGGGTDEIQIINIARYLLSQ